MNNLDWCWVNPINDDETINLTFSKDQVNGFLELTDFNDQNEYVINLSNQIKDQLKTIHLATLKKCVHTLLGYNSGVDAYKTSKEDLNDYLVVAACLEIGDNNLT